MHCIHAVRAPQVTRLTLYDNQIGRIDAAAFDGLTRWAVTRIILVAHVVPPFFLRWQRLLAKGKKESLIRPNILCIERTNGPLIGRRGLSLCPIGIVKNHRLLLWVHNAREKVFEVPSTIIRMRKRESGEGRAMLSLRLQKRLLLLAQLFPSLWVIFCPILCCLAIAITIA